MNKPTIAICYDFDGTLTPKNMQEYDFIPKKLGIASEDFWDKVKKNAKEHDMDEILSYLDYTLDEAKEKNVKIDKNSLENYGKDIMFFDGVEEWFKKIDDYGKEKKMRIEHYIISSGLKPMIKGSSISKNFTHIFACDFKYDQHNVAKFPSAVVNYTTKTQYLFRVNKHNSSKKDECSLLNNWDDRVNQYSPDKERPIPFSRMIYIGDGLTDVPAMKMINYQGGYSIAVYSEDRKRKNKPSSKDACEELLKNKRCSFIAPANYKENKALDTLVKIIIDKISCEIRLQKYTKTNKH